MALSANDTAAWSFIVFLCIPLLAYLVYWIVGLVRRIRTGGGDAAAGEGEA